MGIDVFRWNFLTILLLLIISGCGGGGGTRAVEAIAVTLTADKTQAIASTSDNVTLMATVSDGNGSPIAGQAIDFNVPAGTYPYVSLGRTNSNGTATIHLSNPPIGPNRSAVLAVTATSGGVTSNEIVITFSNPQNTAAISLEADKTTVIADGVDKVKLTATTKGANGLPLAGQAVDFVVPLGFLAGISRFTNTSGQTFVILRPGPNQLNQNQVISMTASSSGQISNAISMSFTAP